MSLEAWLAFAAASAIMLAIPGPTILLVVSYALGHGRKTALATVSGVALGDFTAMQASPSFWPASRLPRATVTSCSMHRTG